MSAKVPEPLKLAVELAREIFTNQQYDYIQNHEAIHAGAALISERVRPLVDALYAVHRDNHGRPGPIGLSREVLIQVRQTLKDAGIDTHVVSYDPVALKAAGAE